MGKKKGKGKYALPPSTTTASSTSSVTPSISMPSISMPSTSSTRNVSSCSSSVTPSISMPSTSTSPENIPLEARALVSTIVSEPKIRTINPEDLGMQFKRKLAFTKFPERPGYGSFGKRIKLISNCFSLKVPSGHIYHYDVTISKIQCENSSAKLLALGSKENLFLSSKRKREVLKLVLSENPLFNNVYAVYDGQKNIYTRNIVKGNFPITCEVSVPYEDDNRENSQKEIFVVQIKPVYKEDGSCIISLDSMHAFYEKRINSVPQETVMALETILRQRPCLKFTHIGHSFFSPPNPEQLHPLGGGLEIWFGYHQSIRLGQWGPMVNLNSIATSFYEKKSILQSVADFFKMEIPQLRQKANFSAVEMKKLSNKFKDIKVEVTHLKNYRRKYKIVRFTKENANKLEFEIKENGRTIKTTVAKYFKARYGKSLDFPNLPCLQVSPEKKKTFLPIEVCEIVSGQHYKKKLEGPQLREMIRFTAISPRDRFAGIKQIVDNPEFSNDPHVRQFGMEVSKIPIKCEGRVLNSPTVVYKNVEIKPVNGSWDMRQKRFHNGAIIRSWVLLCFVNVNVERLKPFSDLLMKLSREMGMSIDQPKYVNKVDIFSCDIKNLLLQMKENYQAQLAVIVLPANDKIIYGKIKQTAETIVGLNTQCVKENNIFDQKKLTYQLVVNICQKINTKCGGENNTLLFREMPSILHKPVIIIGADVNHPGIQGMKPSLAACVSSLDMKLSKYAVSIRAQMNMNEKKQSLEIILDLKNMVLDLLKTFYQHTRGKKPEKIIFYRDGISQGQFDIVHDHEIKHIRNACRSLPGQYEPGITFIVVQKRHHVRFMPENPGDGVGTVKNIPPGTIVDKDVSDPTKFDFFLCSHLGLKGTSRPSYYTVLEDDNKFTPDDLQKMTYQLCHTYSRCTKSISVPVPVAYADLAAYRARYHLEAALEETANSSDSSVESYASISPSVIESIKVLADLQKAMYFV